MNFDAFLRSIGLRPRRIQDDGVWRRCPTEDHPKKRNGAYKLFPGGDYGLGQDWAVMERPAVWRAGGESQVPRFDPDLLRQAEAEARESARRATMAAGRFYQGCPPLRHGHAYLESHGLDVTGCLGLRVDSEGWLVIPALRAGALQSLQRIAPDGAKRFWPGAPIAGSSYMIDRRNAPVTVLCEGLATGLACFRALTDCRVIVAWDAGNLARTPERPRGMVVIAADNDHRTAERLGKNPGLEAAERAASEIGAGIAYPENIQGTDWCDWRTERIAAREGQRHAIREVDAELRDLLLRQARWRA